MTLIELCELYWWSINDSTTNPLLISKATITLFINAALKELSQIVVYRKNTSVTPAVHITSITLPTDLLKLERITWAEKELLPMYDIQLAERVSDSEDEDATSDVTNYYPLSKTTIGLYPAPITTDLGPYQLWYKAYLPELTVDTDEPSLVPEEYHKDLVLLFVRAQHALKLGRYSEYQFLLKLWEDIKKEIGGIEIARIETRMDEAPGTFGW